MSSSIVPKIGLYAASALLGYFSLVFFLDHSRPNPSQDILLRRNFIVHTLAKGPSAVDLFSSATAQYQGEWVLGAYSMAAMALTNIAMQRPDTAPESSRLIASWIRICLDRKIYAFDQQAWREDPLDEKVLADDRGHIGYYGHLNMMLGCYALLNKDGAFKDLHLRLSQAIAKRMRKFAHRHVETYPGETYPPDNTVGVASLKVADMTMGQQYGLLIHEWLTASQNMEQQPYGLIPFQIHSETGKPLQSFRGSNTGWNSFFLPMIDESYAQHQFEHFKKLMLVRLGAFAAFKEYPQGGWFKMDCDTGPVIFGMGATATAFAIAGAQRLGDRELTSGLLRSIELVGTSMTKQDMRRYMTVPVVGDAIILAMRTACRWRPL